MFYCEKCRMLNEQKPCQSCNGKRLRMPKNNDYCLLIEIDYVYGKMLGDLLKGENIAYVDVPSGTGVRSAWGQRLENLKFSYRMSYTKEQKNCSMSFLPKLSKSKKTELSVIHRVRKYLSLTEVSMPIETEKNEIKEQQEQLNGAISEKSRVPETKKSGLTKWTNALLILSILAVLYSASYLITPLLTLLPAIILWLIWFCVVAVPTVITLGTIWLNEDWKTFNRKFINFNVGITEFSLGLTEIFYQIFPFVASFFGLCVLAFFILSIIGRRKTKNRFKGKLIWSIVLLVLFVGFIIIDINYFISM